jgi:cytoskeletal protein RodZ
MGELGNTLSRARRARGITLEEAERDTHVSRRYLQALESEDFSTFPAPVYARGFLRTYSRYLGLNPDELVRVFPNGSLSVDIGPLPQVTHPSAQVVSLNWLIGGAVALFLLGAAFLVFQNEDDPTLGSGLSTQSSPVATSSGVEQIAPPSQASDAPTQGKPIEFEAGKLPDLVGADLPSALTYLQDSQTGYIIIEVDDQIVPSGLIISQSPGAGAESGPSQSVTVVVSRGVP